MGCANSTAVVPPASSPSPAPAPGASKSITRTSTSEVLNTRERLQKQRTLRGMNQRKPCKYGVKCFRKNPEHLKDLAHVGDDDYALSMRLHGGGLVPSFLTLKHCFMYADPYNVGYIDDPQFFGEMLCCVSGTALGAEAVQKLWDELDDDGNGFLSLAEFLEWAATRPNELGYACDLPVGLGGGDDDENYGKCSFFGCTCAKFQHDPSAGGGTVQFCSCGHKRLMHEQDRDVHSAVMYPLCWEDWTTQLEEGKGDTTKTIAVHEESVVQQVFDASYGGTWTRDRGAGNTVPNGFQVESVTMNVNTKVWRKYWLKRGHVIDDLERDPDPSPTFLCKTSSFLPDSLAGGPTGMNEAINEWFLFHGTNEGAIDSILKGDFTIRTAGTATGTLYGRGLYLAESITKADEYTEENSDGLRTILICRVVGGKVKYSDDVDPDPEALMNEVLYGPYDSVLGDREKCRGTYKEFVIYDADQVYPAYVVKYRRIVS